MHFRVDYLQQALFAPFFALCQMKAEVKVKQIFEVMTYWL